MIGDNEAKCLHQLSPGWVVELPTGRRLVEGDHSIEIQQPDDRLARSQVCDDVADLDRMPIVTPTPLATSQAQARVASRGVSSAASKPSSSRTR